MTDGIINGTWGVKLSVGVEVPKRPGVWFAQKLREQGVDVTTSQAFTCVNGVTTEAYRITLSKGPALASTVHNGTMSDEQWAKLYAFFVGQQMMYECAPLMATGRPALDVAQVTEEEAAKVGRAFLRSIFAGTEVRTRFDHGVLTKMGKVWISKEDQQGEDCCDGPVAGTMCIDLLEEHDVAAKVVEALRPVETPV